MTTTSQPMRVRPPESPARAPHPPLTFGRPRRSRQSNRTVAVVVSAALPIALGLGIGAVVIHGYHAHTKPVVTRPTAGATADASAETGANDHAPTGPDVGTTGLNPQLSRAITRAREAAKADGVTIDIVSGYRTAATQQALFDQAVVKYGSAREATRWVLPPDKSEHVKGGAVDVGPYAATRWLKNNGVKFGLCQRYANEYWHFEVLAPAKDQPCPALEADASSG